MPMIRIKIILIVSLVLLEVGCFHKRVPLNRKEFTMLLIEMHRTDAVLNIARSGSLADEEKSYTYYNALFKKYGIDKAQFDSCMHYYSSQTVLFSKIYDVVIDSLNKQLTVKELVLNSLKSKDSLNLFPITDTLVFDSCYIAASIEMDSITPGLYLFSATIQFDTLDAGENNRITSFFVSKNGRDTLKVHKVEVFPDSIQHVYSWSRYIDTAYNRLVIKFVDADNLEKLKARSGKAWGINLFKPYLSARRETMLKQALRHERAASLQSSQ